MAGARRWPLGLVALGLLLLAAVVAAAIWAARRSDGTGPSQAAARSAHSTARLEPVELVAAGSFDPEGDDHAEHTADVPKAVDGDPSTYWTTQHYNDLAFGKSGVGLVLDASRPQVLRRLVVTTDTPRFHARIRGGSSAQGPFPVALSDVETIDASTTIPLRPKAVRYVLVWLTQLPPGSPDAHVNEVKAFG